ncbi:MAG TPA: hypothetical protein VFT51_08290 [Bacillales bacterium]|nr:hypothetical protein [Bacillales bacterium]
MAFNEKEAIRFRMEKIADEKKVLYQRDRELDKEYNFYIGRLRELDRNGLGSPTSLSHGEPMESPQITNSKKEYSGNLKQYDFDALKRGLSNFKGKPKKLEESSIPTNPHDRRKRGKQYNLEEVAAVVEEILKEENEPLAIHKLRDILSERGYTWKHFLPTLPNIMKHSQHIEKPYRGHVAYVEKQTENELPDMAKAASEEVATGVEANLKDAAGEIPDSVISGERKVES